MIAERHAGHLRRGLFKGAGRLVINVGRPEERRVFELRHLLLDRRRIVLDDAVLV